MRALDPEVVDTVWAGLEPLIPVPVDTHPLGRHRLRKSNRNCFEVILVRLVTGCSWEDAERLCANRRLHNWRHHRFTFGLWSIIVCRCNRRNRLPLLGRAVFGHAGYSRVS